jgi:hypothetical protein
MLLRSLLPFLLLLSPLLAQLPASVIGRPQRGCQIVAPMTDGNYTGARWTNGRVPFAFAANVTPAMQAAILVAMQDLHSSANVTFVPRVNETDYVLISDSVINSSVVGRFGGAQVLRVFNWNVRYEMVHVLLHVLGYWHEHQRPDRDLYVQVQAANVDPAQITNFEIVPTGGTFGRPYDFDSVLHFSATEGGLNGATTLAVLPPNSAQQSAIGQRTHLSVGDLDALRLVYGSITPPAISSSAPGVVNCWLPGQVVLTGTLFDEATRVLIDGSALSTFTLLSPTQIRFNMTNLLIIGPHQVQVESPIGRSAPFLLPVAGNDPPVLEVPAAAVRNLSALYRVHSDNQRTNILLGAFDNLPSTIPGVISLGLGNQFTSAITIITGIGGINGMLVINLTVPLAVPAGTRMWLQSIVFDPANLTLPIRNSTVAEVRIF